MEANRLTVGYSFRKALWAGAILMLAANVSAQNLFEADEDSGNIYEFTPGGVQSTFASGLSLPAGVAFNSAGDLFVASGSSIIEITPAGAQSTFASVNNPSTIVFNNASNLFVVSEGDQIQNFGKGVIIEITPDGTQSTFATLSVFPNSVAFDSAGNLFALVNTAANALKHITASSSIIEITPDGTQSTYATLSTDPNYALAFNSYGDLFVANSASITEYTSGGSQTYLSGLDDPRFIIFDSAGDLFVANSGANNIIELTQGGAQSTLASGLDYPDELAISPPPALQAVGAGVQSNQFGFTMTGSNNEVVVVQTCTNLFNPVWISVSTNTLTNGSTYFSDPQSTNYSSGYYRIVSP